MIHQEIDTVYGLSLRKKRLSVLTGIPDGDPEETGYIEVRMQIYDGNKLKKEASQVYKVGKMLTDCDMMVRMPFSFIRKRYTVLVSTSRIQYLDGGKLDIMPFWSSSPIVKISHINMNNNENDTKKENNS